MQQKVKKLKNGMIAIIDGQLSTTSKKWLDVEITNCFPLIALPEHAFLRTAKGASEDISGLDHLSIPPDLRLHLSGKNQHIFFDTSAVFSAQGEKPCELVHLFTYVGPPIDRAPYLSGGKTRKWNQVVLISPFRDEKLNPVSTRVFIDFYIHEAPDILPRIIAAPFCMRNMRLAFDRSGCTLGPYRFGGLQRRSHYDSNLLFTLRFGYAELEINDAAYVYIPFPQESTKAQAADI
jgi:hypothetical protein